MVVEYLLSSALREIHGIPIAGYIEWEYGESVDEYIAGMVEDNRWGGALEMVVMSEILGVNIQVYEDCGDEYRMIWSCGENEWNPVCRIVFEGRCHYDVLRMVNEG